VIVCHCKGINDRTIRQLVRDGAGSRREVGLACSAGRLCGGCVRLIREVIDDERNGASAPALPVAAAS